MDSGFKSHRGKGGMTFNPDLHHRHSIRLREYDCSRTGAYFVTICAKDRASLFGEIVDGTMRLSDAGRMIEQWWLELNRKFVNAQTDEYAVMPNHVHGIVVIGESIPTERGASKQSAHAGAPLQAIVQWFKTMTTNDYIRGVKTSEWPAFPGKLWQRNYYEHVVRDDESLNHIRQYIIDNPAQWAFDRENPDAPPATKESPQKTLDEAWHR